jgi:hypothetical protein
VGSSQNWQTYEALPLGIAAAMLWNVAFAFVPIAWIAVKHTTTIKASDPLPEN